MDKDEKRAVAQEIFENMAVTKDEYVQITRLIDALDLAIYVEPEKEESWDEILN